MPTISNFFTNFDDTAFYTTGNNGTTTGDGEYVFDRQQERLVSRTLWFGMPESEASQFGIFAPLRRLPALSEQNHERSVSSPGKSY